MKALIIARIKLTAAVFAALFSLHCADLSGGGSEAGNARIIGRVLNTQGTPASNVKVTVTPSGFDPVKETPLPGAALDTTGTDGIFVLTVRKSRTYTIQAVHMTLRTRALIAGLAVDDTDIASPPCTLNAPGAVKVMLPDSADKTLGYIFVPGTSVLTFLNNAAGFVFLDSVPAGTIPAVSYSSTSISVPAVIRYDVPIDPGDTTVVWNPSWKYARRLFLNTTTGGADVSGDVCNFPVLVRLSAGNFTFAQAEADGRDLRFTKNDGTPLPYELERYDAGSFLAEIWVTTDTVYGNDSSHFITMYWGNPDTSDNSNGAAVFDTADGFMGVWHLAGAGSATAVDATHRHYDGTPSDTAPQTTQGVIGGALLFDGNANGLIMKNTATSPLNFPRPGTYTFSAWVSVDSVYDEDEFIAGKGLDQYALRIKGAQSVPASMFALHEYVGAPIYGTEMRYAPAALRQWKYMVGVRDPAGSYLFIDGRCVDSTGMIIYGGGNPADTTNFSIGRCGAAFNGNDYLPFQGKVDEVRIASVRFSADWIKLSYMNQKTQDALVKW
jgi:hypothetical protein